MSTCKDCLHCEVCEFNDGLKKWCNPDYLCPHFKNKADYAPVVRCKDCKYAKYLKLAGVLSCLYWNTHSTEENSFCSYGEKESEVQGG